MNFDVKGKTALVTGANRGIGQAITQTLLDQGVKKVYAAVRNVDSVASLVDQAAGRVEAINVDLSKPDTITAAAEKASDVELLINNAGILMTGFPLDDGMEDAFKTQMDVNVYGLMRLCKAFAPILKANGGGAIVQLNSVASLRCFGGFATYAASKAASYSITQGIRDQLADQNTLVVSVHPGPIDTDMAKKAGLEGDPPQVVADAIVEGLREGRFHVFPDSFAKQIWEAYEGFGSEVVDPATAEA